MTTLSLATSLPFEDFFASAPSAGPQVGDFAQKRLERLFGVGDDGVVFLLFQDLFHRTSVDVHEFHSIIRRSKFGRLIYFAAIIRGGAPVAFGRAPLSSSADAADSTPWRVFRARSCRRFVDYLAAPGIQPPF